MPITYRIDAEQRLVEVRISGTFTMDEVLDRIEEIFRDPDFRRGFSFLSDHTGLTEFLTPAQARELVSFLERSADQVAGTKWAVVTTHPASYGMFRMVSVLVEKIPMSLAIFRSPDEARAWLLAAPEAAAGL